MILVTVQAENDGATIIVTTTSLKVLYEFRVYCTPEELAEIEQAIIECYNVLDVHLA